MSKAKTESTDKKINPLPKMPSMNFGKQSMGVGGVKSEPQPRSFVPQTFRVTQHKGGGGK